MNDAYSSQQGKIGVIGEIRVADVLLKLEQSARDARVWFETEFGVGEVLFHKGKMLQARMGGARGQTALLRLLGVNEGKYGIEARSVASGTAIIQDVKSLIELHSSRQEEWVELCSHAPPLSSVLRLTGSGADVRDSSRGIQRVVFVLIDGRRTLMQVLDESSFDPVDALRIVTQAVQDGLVQHAPQPNTLFPLASTGDASGVLPRFAPPAPLPRLDPASASSSGVPAPGRHSTLVGLGEKATAVTNPPRGLAPSPIIDLGHKSHAAAAAETGQTHEVPSLIKTVITGFGLGKRSSRGSSSSSARLDRNNLGISEHPENESGIRISDAGFVIPHRNVAAQSDAGDDSNKPRADESGPPSEGFTVAGVLPKTGAGRRFVGRYEILLRIGRGGMGTVYLCRLNSEDVGFRRLFALKLLRSHLSRDTQAANNFLEEARVAGYLHHANVVAVCDAGFHGKQPYLVMEYVEGCSLKQLLRSLPSRSPYLLLPVVIDALAGLHAAHTLLDESGAELKLVHCDVSPENMLVGVDGNCRLNDFGIARKANLTLGTTTRGKPGYVAPEQVAGQQFDHRADIFSMGVVLWGALTGQRLFAGATVEETLFQVCNKPIPPPSAAGAQSYPALDEIVLRALARDPDQRFASADEMLTALSRVGTAHDGLATPKEIAAWVREAAGSELTQRRLAVLDASQVTDSTSSDGDATTEVSNAQADADGSAHVVLTGELLASDASEPPASPVVAGANEPASAELAASPSGASENEPVSAEPAAVAAENAWQPISSGPPSSNPPSMVDVSSLFYGKDGMALKGIRSLSPTGVHTVSAVEPQRARPFFSKRRVWSLLALIVLISGLAVLFALRARKSPGPSGLETQPSSLSGR